MKKIYKDIIFLVTENGAHKRCFSSPKLNYLTFNKIIFAYSFKRKRRDECV